MTSYSSIPELNQLAFSFIQRCKSLKTDKLSLNPYNLKYLNGYLEKIEYNTYIASSIAEHFWDLRKFQIIDFGGGIGFNSAFFQHIGFKSVVLVDHDEHCVFDAQKVHKALELTVDAYLHGGLEWIENQNLSETLVTSRDVIEHVYDLEAFFSSTKKAYLNAHNTAAIHDSVFRKREFERIHHKAEYLGFHNEGIKEMDSQTAYEQMRREYLNKKLLKKGNINQLVKETRGLTYTDIDMFLENQAYDTLPKKHLYTNTCNPKTGNWAERTLPLSAYRSFSKAAGIDQIQFELLKYNTYNCGTLKKTGLKAINFVVEKSNNQRLAPSFTLIY